MKQRQQVLFLWLAESALDSDTVGWAFYDGTSGDGPQPSDEAPPYASGLAALKDGWFLLQAPSPSAAHDDHDHATSYLRNEFVFARAIERQGSS